MPTDDSSSTSSSSESSSSSSLRKKQRNNSATEISTDSEFAQDDPTPTREFNDFFVTKTRGSGSTNIKKVQVNLLQQKGAKNSKNKRKSGNGNLGNLGGNTGKNVEVRLAPLVPNTSSSFLAHAKSQKSPKKQLHQSQKNYFGKNDISNKNLASKMALMRNENRGLTAEGYALNRTQSTGGIATKMSLELRKKYLLGDVGNTGGLNNLLMLQKSGSASTLDNKLKSFHSNISDCQKLLKPAAANPQSENEEALAKSIENMSNSQLGLKKQAPVDEDMRIPKENQSGIGKSTGSQSNPKDNSRRLIENAGIDVANDNLQDLQGLPKVSNEVLLDNLGSASGIEYTGRADPKSMDGFEETQGLPMELDEEPFENELEGRPRSPVHETTIIVPQIDWKTAKTKKKSESFEDSLTSGSSSNEEVDENDKTLRKLHKSSTVRSVKMFSDIPKLEIYNDDGDIITNTHKELEDKEKIEDQSKIDEDTLEKRGRNKETTRKLENDQKKINIDEGKVNLLKESLSSSQKQEEEKEEYEEDMAFDSLNVYQAEKSSLSSIYNSLGGLKSITSGKKTLNEPKKLPVLDDALENKEEGHLCHGLLDEKKQANVVKNEKNKDGVEEPLGSKEGEGYVKKTSGNDQEMSSNLKPINKNKDGFGSNIKLLDKNDDFEEFSDWSKEDLEEEMLSDYQNEELEAKNENIKKLVKLEDLKKLDIHENLDNIEFMDSGSAETTSTSDNESKKLEKNKLKNNGYFKLMDEDDILEARNPKIATLDEDFDDISLMSLDKNKDLSVKCQKNEDKKLEKICSDKNKTQLAMGLKTNESLLEKDGADDKNTSNNFGGEVIDIKAQDLQEMQLKNSLQELEEDSLIFTEKDAATTEENTISDSTVKNVTEKYAFAPSLENLQEKLNKLSNKQIEIENAEKNIYENKKLENNLELNNLKLDLSENKLVGVSLEQIDIKKNQDKQENDKYETYEEHCQRLQSKIDFGNAKDSIDIRKSKRKNSKNEIEFLAKPDLIKEEESPKKTRSPQEKIYKKEEIEKERNLNQKLIQEMVMNKMKAQNKSLERKKRNRNSFSPNRPFELSKSATTNIAEHLVTAKKLGENKTNLNLDENEQKKQKTPDGDVQLSKYDSGLSKYDSGLPKYESGLSKYDREPFKCDSELSKTGGKFKNSPTSNFDVPTSNSNLDRYKNVPDVLLSTLKSSNYDNNAKKLSEFLQNEAETNRKFDLKNIHKSQTITSISNVKLTDIFANAEGNVKKARPLSINYSEVNKKDGSLIKNKSLPNINTEDRKCENKFKTDRSRFKIGKNLFKNDERQSKTNVDNFKLDQNGQKIENTLKKCQNDLNNFGLPVAPPRSKNEEAKLKLKENAMLKAKLKSNEELGLSPEDKIKKLREKLQVEKSTPKKFLVEQNTSKMDEKLTKIDQSLNKNEEGGLVKTGSDVFDVKFGAKFENLQFENENIENLVLNTERRNSLLYYSSNDTLKKKKNESFRTRSKSGEQYDDNTEKRAKSFVDIKNVNLDKLQFCKSDPNIHQNNEGVALKMDERKDKDANKKDKKRNSKEKNTQKSIGKFLSNILSSASSKKKEASSSYSSGHKSGLFGIGIKYKDKSKNSKSGDFEENTKKSRSFTELALEKNRERLNISPPPIPPLPTCYLQERSRLQRGDSSQEEEEAAVGQWRGQNKTNDDYKSSCDTLDQSGVDDVTAGGKKQKKSVAKAVKQAQYKRHRMAQEIQRKLEETEVKSKELEIKGVQIEKALRGESNSKEMVKEEAELLKEWFDLMRDITELRRYERELTVRAQELELEDRHARLQYELRQRLENDDDKTQEDVEIEGSIIKEMMDIVAKRDSLIALLEEDRLRYSEEDKEFEDQQRQKKVKK